MEKSNSNNCHIAIVAPSPEDYETARALLDEPEPEYQLPSSGAACSVGKVGPHDVVLVGKTNDMTNVSVVVKDTVDDLLEAFPCIRAGFLIGVDATAPEKSLATPGDIVVAFPHGLQPGQVQFSANETIVSKRISTTFEMSRPPSCVQSAINGLRSPIGHEQWQRCLATKLSRPEFSSQDATEHSFHPSKVYGGKIASSSSFLSDNVLVDQIGSSNKIICFERAAADLQPRLPILTICGIVSSTNSSTISDTAIRRTRAAAVIYAMFVARRIGTMELEQQENFTDLFQYESFDLERPGFRLIRLARGFKSQLKCHLFQAYLDEEDLIPYEGLSYVWGSQDTPNEIDVNGKSLAITASLHDALWLLRQIDEDRILWVDAVCIDQSNIKERGHQVTHMGEIYRKADNVIFWLGYLSGDAALLKSTIDRFKRQLPPQAFRQWSREDYRWNHQWKRAQDGCQKNYERLYNGLRSFMENPWFSRVWILQEVANAKRAIVECNIGSIPAKVFALLPHAMNIQVSEQCQAILDIMPGPLKGSSWWNQNRNLCNLMWKFRGCQATDPRDRVYALLGMASDTEYNDIRADYAKSESAVMKDFAGYLLCEEWPGNDPPAPSIEVLQSELPALSKEMLLQRLEQQIPHSSLGQFLSRQGPILKIDDSSMLDIVQRGSENTSLFLDRAEKGFHFTSRAALQCLLWYPDVFETLLQRPKSVIRPTPEFIASAIESRPEILERLLGLSPNQDRLRERAFVSTIKRGLRSCKSFLKHCDIPVPITSMMLRVTLHDLSVLEHILWVARTPVQLHRSIYLKATPQNNCGIRILDQHSQPIMRLTKKIIDESEDKDADVLNFLADFLGCPDELREYLQR
ncbi:heterokaryon incompatibility protein [Fusarium tjaetaba]|uniref:Heterokaryon incompatibility protein n=1 Tax=Fusarium tjaetaba TaxID=1567544 RepID=A0A8H5W3K3_9HYPO|nr:heterokaryon incompatibility protein [Fusarium tjaetaba]KAF5647747.1 heterokaryon incompatibility protein [Fusarium tjaetaba]